MRLPHKICPECGEEYVHAAIACVHCDVALVLPSAAVAREEETLAPAGELSLVRTASLAWVRRFSDRLGEAGIPHRIEAVEVGGGRGPATGSAYGVYVRSADVEHALRIDAEQLRSEIPDLPEDAQAGHADGCPACGEPVAADASECVGCGLPFLDAE